MQPPAVTRTARRHSHSSPDSEEGVVAGGGSGIADEDARPHSQPLPRLLDVKQKSVHKALDGLLHELRSTESAAEGSRGDDRSPVVDYEEGAGTVAKVDQLLAHMRSTAVSRRGGEDSREPLPVGAKLQQLLTHMQSTSHGPNSVSSASSVAAAYEPASPRELNLTGMLNSLLTEMRANDAAPAAASGGSASVPNDLQGQASPAGQLHLAPPRKPSELPSTQRFSLGESPAAAGPSRFSVEVSQRALALKAGESLDTLMKDLTNII